jgi:beta-lactam-binding protein with PASTA domain
MNIEQATQQAIKSSFNIIVNDSVHIVGKPGGEIIDQNPKPGSEVKENRKVYVTITKYIADKISARSLPTLYGREFEQKKQELAYMNLNAAIRDFRYDPGEPNHILEVYYKGEQIVGSTVLADDVMIEKGGTLEFVLSKRVGGDSQVPLLVCMDKESALFLIENLRFKVGKITGPENGYVVAQIPAYENNKMIHIGDTIDLTISEAKPLSCN